MIKKVTCFFVMGLFVFCVRVQAQDAELLTNQETVSSQDSATSSAKPVSDLIPIPSAESAVLTEPEVPAESKPVVLPVVSEAVAQPTAIAFKNNYFVEPLNDIILFYKTEIQAIEKKMQIWNERISSYDKRLSLIKDQRRNAQTEIARMEDEDSKRNKRSIKRLEKQMDKLQDDEKDLRKEMKKISKQLIEDVEDLEKEVHTALSDKYENVREEIKILGND